jgi:hypothetical protein
MSTTVKSDEEHARRTKRAALKALNQCHDSPGKFAH